MYLWTQNEQKFWGYVAGRYKFQFHINAINNIITAKYTLIWNHKMLNEFFKQILEYAKSALSRNNLFKSNHS